MRLVIILFSFLVLFQLSEISVAHSDFTQIASKNAFNNSTDDAYRISLTADFAARDQLPQTEISQDKWETCCGSWWPRPLLYPLVKAPSQYPEVQWSRDRIIEVAKKYIGLPYLHRHIPAAGGLDCSNFSSWVYNYGLGIGIISNVHQQGMTAGRKLSSSESLEPADLLFFYCEDNTKIGHVAIYINQLEIIDSSGRDTINPGVQIRKFEGRYKDRFAWARRVLE